MKNKIIFMLFAIIFPFASCEVDNSTIMSEDYPQNYKIVYGLRQVLEYDPMNISGIDISKKMDFFSSVKLTLFYNDGKLTHLTYSNGKVPFSPFAFETNGEIDEDCELDYNKVPNELRIRGTDKVIAYFINGEFVMPFQLDCSSISYKYTFVNISQ